MSPRDRISATFLNQVAESVVQRITVRGGKVSRVGTSIMIDLTGGTSGTAGSKQFYAEILNAGPAAEADVTGAAYWVREAVLTKTGNTLGYAEKTDGRHVVAFNICELGLGTSGLGLHGLMPSTFPAGITEAPPRVVLVTAGRDTAGELIYTFNTEIGAYWSGRYIADTRTLVDGCPSTYRWDEVGATYVLIDTDVGDDIEV